MHRLTIPDAEVCYRPGWIDPATADRTLAALHDEIAWVRPSVTLFGKRHPVPRLCAWYGDPGCEYTWSRIRQVPRPWTPTLSALRAQLEAEGMRFDGVLVNLYRTGLDHMGWHADDEPELGPTIASISLGATRSFRMRHRDPNIAPVQLDLESGSLLTMAGVTQVHWKHALPKRTRVDRARINLTFREVRRRAPAPLRTISLAD